MVFDFLNRIYSVQLQVFVLTSAHFRSVEREGVWRAWRDRRRVQMLDREPGRDKRNHLHSSV